MVSHGGARNRSAPQPDPNSATSERRGLAFKLLPREGFSGKPPRFPLPAPSTRERALWRQLWKTPQAAMWDTEPWRHYLVAQYTRFAVRAEAADAPVSALTGAMRLADQIGLSPAGLKENGWRLAVDEVASHRGSEEASPAPAAKARSARRLRAVND